MAVAAPALAIAGFALLAFSEISQPARAQDRCAPRLPQLALADGTAFRAAAYGRANWTRRAAGGKRLRYAMHVWKGTVGGRTAYLTFDEIPSASGPNYHMDYRLKPVPARIARKQRAAPFVFDPRVIVYIGPLRGEWSVTNCAVQ